ncbi:DUF1592 domain-containing protein [Pseudohaliea rubra]|uniref:DUF1592 domain-containing protein n=1 Tax=Pseudohaliea rubra TaxID=475795 RepID=UPI00068ECA08|nr:DUF1592 domain-containing protein [Pseudohaliea rubra]
MLFTALLVGCNGGSESPVPEDPSAQRARLLTADQYRNSIAAVFGDDIADSVLSPMPPLSRTAGLRANGAAEVGLTSDQLSQIQRSAAAVAAKVVDPAHRDFLLPCRPADANAADAVCAERFLREAGRLLQRRPLADERLAALVDGAGRAAAQTDDFYTGLALALEAVLISPEFLFIADRSEPDPERPGARRLDGYALASRLSFFLWNGPPDDALLAAAASGELHSEEGLRLAVERMLASSRLEAGTRAFFDDMLAFDAFDSLAKDPMVYPRVTGATLAQAREQTLRTIVDHVLVRDLDYRDLFTTRRTFLSPALAVVYGLPVEPGWTPHEFSEDSPRIGLLTQVSYLAAHSHAVRSSPTQRGKALREEFLCQVVPDPPPNVDFSTLEENEHAKTARERLDAHNSNPACAGCHLVTDPMGLALEHFDGAGQYRATENGAEIDTAGELDGALYDGVEGLARALRNHPKLPGCLVNRVYAWGTGGPASPVHDRNTLAWLEDRFAAEGYRLRGLFEALATSPAFRTVRPAEEAVKLDHGPGPTAPARISEAQLALRDTGVTR